LKSSPRDRSFATFVRRALDAIEREVPWVHDALVRAMDATTTIIVDGEPATVQRGARGAITVAAEARASDVVCTTNTEAILDLVSGRETLLAAVESDRLHLIGGMDALLVWHDMLQLFLHGAVRARAFDGLLGEFRGRLHGDGRCS
jgi:hypothetical protein